MIGEFFVKGSCPAVRSSAALASFVGVVLMTACQAHAQVYWSTSAGDWFGASNWSGNLVPTSTDNAWIANGGTTNITQLGEICGTLSLGSSAGSGAVQMTGGSLYTTSNQYVGDSGTGIFTQSGGTNSIGSSLSLGYNAVGSGTYNLDGGVLVSSSLSAGSGTAVFNFNGGTLQAGGGYSTAVPMTLGGSGGGGTFNAAGYATTFSGLLSGPGGLTLSGPGMLTLGGSNSYTLSIAAGATLDLGGGSQQVASLSDKTPGSGGNIVNSGTTASVLTLSPSGGPTTFSGMIQGGGALGTVSLVMSGSGTQVLAGSNTYTGPTTINQGTLVVDGSLASPVTINSGGVLGGSGSLGSVSVRASGQIAPGSPAGTLHISGSLSLASGAIMDYDLDTPSTSDSIFCGSLVSGSPLGLSNFDFTWTSNFGPGTYDLIETNSLPGGVLGTSTSGTIDGLPANIAVQGNDVVLNVVPEPSTLALLGAGAVGLAGFVWRRRKLQKSS